MSRVSSWLRFNPDRIRIGYPSSSKSNAIFEIAFTLPHRLTVQLYRHAPPVTSYTQTSKAAESSRLGPS
jgi:hypothetical protein